ncbi:MAG: magnesium-translocating P-type ATPase [Candidatus Terraquivivens tikiterensis]|uniref:Magnesium-transporting ATPase, P-type 1 n=1 Tax=Candidatus Terraquivivens tikiterensis TaxID=1980982 RepID=A0A2R7Y1K1_9ARCH|nr:MAG: magnesium-translocating P-type ATPase [Candidatus Terraquivivens tikiterensis]
MEGERVAVQKLKAPGFGEGLGLALPSIEEILTLPVEELLSCLRSSSDGLSSDEAKRRLEVFGRNELVRKRRAAVADFVSHFKSPLVIILLFAGLISGFLGDVVNTAIIFTIVLLSVILDFYQEFKADRAAEMLKRKVATTATVLRDGAKREVSLPEIVPGDVVFLSAGDIVPADARVISAKDLFVDQSALTGESFPVEKTNSPLRSYDPSITEWSNYLFMGTSVVSGTATAVVVKTGSMTEYGKIASRLVAREPETEFQRGVRSFGYMMMQVTFLLVVFVFFINALYMRGVIDSLLFAVALAVGLTPELLPMIISVNLSKGAVSMAKKEVIVKRLAAIQNFGSMDVLCTDKTGTLTENRIKLVLHVDLNGKESEKVLLYSYLNSYYQTGLRSPLDEAVLRFRHLDVKDYKKVDEVPFDFARKRLSVVVDYQNQRLMITKGAPEEVSKVCSFYEVGEVITDITDDVRQKIEQSYLDLSAEGYRVLAVAYKRLREEKPVYTSNDEKEMVFLGFIAFLDPPKETAKEALQLLKNSGIELKILTGDNELVTRRVCEYLGFEIKGIITGSEIARMHDDALARVVEEANVFCRLTPAQKDRILNALKNNGHVVGFLGDGINDAPSLKTADVGISVENAVDVAKEAADIILLQNDLKVLHDGVLEGRKTFGNIMKYIMMGVSSNFGNMFSVAGASLFLPFLPMLPIQILLNNLLYDFSQSMIPTDEVDKEYLERPKRWDIKFIRLFMLCLGPVSSIFDFLTFFVMLYLFNASEPLFQTAWFVESLTSQTIVIFAIRTKKSPFWKSKPSRPLLLGSVGIIAFALILPYTPLGAIFRFVRPPATFYIALAAILGSYVALAEIIKSWFYRRYGYRLEQALIPPKKIGIYLTKTTKLIQNVIATICLRSEEEITVESLLQDLERIVEYPIDYDQIGRTIQHLKRAGLISFDWRQRTIRREKPLKEYVRKQLMSSSLWPRVAQDWHKINRIIKEKYGKVNQEYQELLLHDSQNGP